MAADKEQALSELRQKVQEETGKRRRKVLLPYYSLLTCIETDSAYSVYLIWEFPASIAISS